MDTVSCLSPPEPPTALELLAEVAHSVTAPSPSRTTFPSPCAETPCLPSNDQRDDPFRAETAKWIEVAYACGSRRCEPVVSCVTARLAASPAASAGAVDPPVWRALAAFLLAVTTHESHAWRAVGVLPSASEDSFLRTWPRRLVRLAEGHHEVWGTHGSLMLAKLVRINLSDLERFSHLLLALATDGAETLAQTWAARSRLPAARNESAAFHGATSAAAQNSYRVAQACAHRITTNTAFRTALWTVHRGAGIALSKADTQRRTEEVAEFFTTVLYRRRSDFFLWAQTVVDPHVREEGETREALWYDALEHLAAGTHPYWEASGPWWALHVLGVASSYTLAEKFFDVLIHVGQHQTA